MTHRHCLWATQGGVCVCVCDRWEQGTVRHIPKVIKGVTQGWKVQEMEMEEHELCWFLSDDGGGSGGKTLHGSQGNC